jgi:hypothetical protein
MIRVIIKGTKMPKAVKLASQIATYCFEQAHEEMRFLTDEQIGELRAAQATLMEAASKHINKS